MSEEGVMGRTVRSVLLAAVISALVILGDLNPAVGQEGPGGGTPGTARNFELVGHEPLFNRGMNAALALYDDYVYVGNRTDGQEGHPNPGILVVDTARPRAPRVAGEIGPPWAGNVNETTRELRVWPRKKLLIVLTFTCSPVIHDCAGGSVVPTFRFFDLSDPAEPEPVLEWVPRTATGQIRTPHEFYLWTDPKDSKRALLWMSLPTGSVDPDVPNMMIVDISDVADGGAPVEVAEGNWNQLYPGTDTPDYPANYNSNLALHSMTPTADGRKTHLAYLSGHFLVLDTSKVAKGAVREGTVESLNDDLLTPPANRPTWDNPNPGHSAVPLPGRPYSFVTDEVYGTFTDPTFGCPWGWARTINVARPARPRIVGEFRIAENTCPPPSEADQQFASYASHNPTLTRNLALVSWHSGGLQAIDISNPTRLRQTGWFSPEPLASVATEDPALSSGDNKVVMWSFPVVRDGLIYVVDIRNGLYILRYTGPRAREVSRLEFLEGNSNLGDARRLAWPARP
jgi:hypothetical protein